MRVHVLLVSVYNVIGIDIGTTIVFPTLRASEYNIIDLVLLLLCAHVFEVCFT